MSKNITDISNWEKEYPFLKEVWEFNNTLDILEDKDKQNHQIYSLCHMILSKIGKDIGAYNYFCSKLLKNLGLYSEKAKFYIRSHDHCNILYNWIYNFKEKHDIPDQIINDCFEEYIKIGQHMHYNYKCSYDTYNGLYEEPIKITLLDIFDNNTQIIKATLMNQDEKISTPCRKYVCECVKIYDDMRQKYCLKGESGDEKYQSTCSSLEKFKGIYKLFFQNNHDLKDKIPSLDDIKNTYMTKCEIYIQEKPVQLANAEERHTLPPLTKPEGKYPPETKSLIPPGDENKGNHMSSTVSTAFGTVAAASSILALLYEFTPGRKWIHAGIGGLRGKMHPNLYAEGPSELLFDGLAHENLNSYNIGYEAAYDP